MLFSFLRKCKLAAKEAARPRPRKASACSGKSTIKFNRDTHAIANSTKMDKNYILWCD
ncbi:MAG: hypothetical protein ACE3JN_06890 [Ectobacillus sp.]